MLCIKKFLFQDLQAKFKGKGIFVHFKYSENAVTLPEGNEINNFVKNSQCLVIREMLLISDNKTRRV